jgi:hypothetical protein
MEIEIFTLCDFAEDIGGKLCIVGTFDTIFAHNFPAVHPSFSLAARIRFDQSETGKHPFSVSFVDEDGREFLPPVEGGLEVKPRPGYNVSTTNMCFTIGQIQLQKPGKYIIDLVLDGKPERSLPLFVMKPDRP